MKRLTVLLVIAVMSWSGICDAQMTFNTNRTGNSLADKAFELAADSWAGEFRDDMTVFLNFGFENMAQDTVSSVFSGTQLSSYADFWSAVGNDMTSSDDVQMFNGLPTGTSFSVYINQTSEALGANHQNPYLDNDGGANNTHVRLTSANAKALGLMNAHAAAIDGTVIFNSAYAWDFDPSNGIMENHMDFFGTAMHEIGHALGFDSGVDYLDTNGDGEFSDNDMTYVSSLDFLRHSNESLAAGADIDWTADSRAKYFSLDGGLTTAATGGSHWSTGEFYGDGEQASHWKDGMNLGVMDPTTDFGLVNSISGINLLALDAIGYDRVNGSFSPVPEPGSLGGLIVLGGYFLSRRRRRL